MNAIFYVQLCDRKKYFSHVFPLNLGNAQFFKSNSPRMQRAFRHIIRHGSAAININYSPHTFEFFTRLFQNISDIKELNLQGNLKKTLAYIL